MPGNHDIFCLKNWNYVNRLLYDNIPHSRLICNNLMNINIENRKVLSIFGSPVSWYRSKPSNAYQIHRNETKHLTWYHDQRRYKYTTSQYFNKYFPKRYVDILFTHGGPYLDIDHHGSKDLLYYIKTYQPQFSLSADTHSRYGLYNINPTKLFHVSIAHDKARYLDIIKRGVIIIDIDMNTLNDYKSYNH